MSSRLPIFIVWISVIALLGLGLIMVASTSLWTVEGENYALLYKQGIYAVLGIIGALVLSQIDYRKIRPYIWWIYGFSLILLALCYVPGIAVKLNGEYRWINLGFRFQPSECSKLILILALANWYTEHKGTAKSFLKGFVAPMVILCTPLVLIFFEKDMGTAVALGVAGFCMLYIAGTRASLLGLSAVFASAVLFYVVTSNENRFKRVIAFTDLYTYREEAGHQQFRALIALSNGEVFGVGLGNGAEKHGYLPYAHTDFIFAPLGEEFGLIGTLGVLIGFTLITIMGIMIALQTKDLFGRLTAIGIVAIIFWPAVLNIAVVSGSLPNTGLPLPFISSGGSNLVFTLAAIGVLTSIQRWSSEPEKPYIDPLLRRNLEENSNNIRL